MQRPRSSSCSCWRLRRRTRLRSAIPRSRIRLGGRLLGERLLGARLLELRGRRPGVPWRNRDRTRPVLRAALRPPLVASRSVACTCGLSKLERPFFVSFGNSRRLRMRVTPFGVTVLARDPECPCSLLEVAGFFDLTATKGRKCCLTEWKPAVRQKENRLEGAEAGGDSSFRSGTTRIG